MQLGVVMNRARHMLPFKASAQHLTPAILFTGLLVIRLPGDLSPEGQRVLAVMGMAVALWITQAFPLAVTGLLAVILLVLIRGVPNVETALIGFSSPVAYFLIGVLAIGLAAKKSGLAEHAARVFMSKARGNPRLLFIQMIASFPVMAFLMPSATTRNAILVHIYEKVLSTWHIPQGAPLAKAVMLSLGSLNRLASTALLTGGMVPVFAASLLGGVEWFRWFLLLAVPYYTLLAVGGILLYLRYRSAFKVFPAAVVLSDRRQWSVQETKVVAVVVIAALLWFSESLHGLPPTVPALIALVLVLAPGTGVLSWSEFERDLGWSNFFVLATAVSLANALVKSGVADWLAAGIMEAVIPFKETPVVLVLVFMVASSLVRVTIPNIEGYLALVFPVSISLAGGLGLNPLVCALAVMIAGDAAFFYPAQSASGVVVYTRGHVSGGGIFWFGVIMSLVAYATVLLVALPYWAVVGEALVS